MFSKSDRFVVIDTNVLVSAMLKWDSNPGRIMEKVFLGEIIPVFNHAILNEYHEVLSRPKFHLPPDIPTHIITGIVDKGILMEADKLIVDMPDPDDIMFFEVTMEARKDHDTFLVTGNLKHFPQKPFIVTPRQMLDILSL